MERDLFNSMVAEVRVSLYPKGSIKDRPTVNRSTDAEEYFRLGWEDLSYCESFKVMFLNRANKVIGIREISRGGIVATVVDLRMIFQAALGVNATAMIVAHNHPSGNLTPSDADIRLTRRIKEAGVIMEINLLDHLILADSGHYSFADEGKL